MNRDFGTYVTMKAMVAKGYFKLSKSGYKAKFMR